jgi:hypothetical protein
MVAKCSGGWVRNWFSLWMASGPSFLLGTMKAVASPPFECFWAKSGFLVGAILWWAVVWLVIWMRLGPSSSSGVIAAYGCECVACAAHE